MCRFRSNFIVKSMVFMATVLAILTSCLSGSRAVDSPRELSDSEKMVVMENDDNDKYRRFVLERKDSGGYNLYAYGQDSSQCVKVIFEKEFEEGWLGMASFVSTDKRYVFTVTDHAPSASGFPWRLVVYRTDINTLETMTVACGPAIKVDNNGFTVASEPECLNPDASSADMVYRYCDINFNFEGEPMEKGQPYLDEELEKRYGERLINIDGVGVFSQ